MKQLLTKYKIFTELPQISHIHKNRNLLINCNLLDQLLLPYNFLWQRHEECTFFHFCQFPLYTLEYFVTLFKDV